MPAENGSFATCLAPNPTEWRRLGASTSPDDACPYLCAKSNTKLLFNDVLRAQSSLTVTMSSR
jgi:hypothetical protein